MRLPEECYTHRELPAACAERTGRRFPSLVRAHEDARLAAASLYSMATEHAAAGHGAGAAGRRGAWQESTLTLRRALLQLTRAALSKCPALFARCDVYLIGESATGTASMEKVLSSVPSPLELW